MTGAPKRIKQLSDEQKEFGKIVAAVADETKAKEALPQLDFFIAAHPDYPDAYFVRALTNICSLNSQNYLDAINDVDIAIAKHKQMPMPNESMYSDLADFYSLRGKLNLSLRDYRRAIDDLDSAMREKMDSADAIFNTGATQPETTSKPCAWNLSDLDTLAAKFPRDYRAPLFRGLYFKFFTSFNSTEDYKQGFYLKAMLQFQKAAILNPKSPLPLYFSGKLYTKAAMMTRAAWRSDEGRDDALRRAAQEYTKAVQLDPHFLPAYEDRASAYLNLKQPQRAIADYDKILELDPENKSAFSDRGIARQDIGQYWAAVSDFGDAIRRSKDGDGFLSYLYEYRADSYMKLRQYREAVGDYSKAIELRFASISFLLSLHQIRMLYPEYDRISDKALCQKIRDQYWPEFDYKTIEEQLTQKNKEYGISLMHELYQKRGDAYLQTNDFRRGVLDFRRIFKGIPDFADVVDRWRKLGTTSDGDYYLDVKSAEPDNRRLVQLWIKTLSKRDVSRLNAYELNCQTRQINQTSSAAYDSGAKLISSSEVSSGWQAIIPDTLGERLFECVCPERR